MTTPAATVDFWFDFASTYSYPAAMTIETEAARRGVAVNWRPFLLGPIFADLGWQSSPFNLQPAKGRYMWRDMERICAGLDLGFRRPDPFPQHSVRAARIALVGHGEGWGPAFCRALFHAEFAGGADIANETTLHAVLRGVGADPGPVLAQSGEPAVKEALRAEVEEARRLGIFGAPTFLAGAELFWGFDRMEAALDWAAGRRPL